MSDLPANAVIKFPPRPAKDQPLVLPRRRLRSPFEVSETAAEAQKAINAIRSAHPWSTTSRSYDSSSPLPDPRVAELEKALKQLAGKLDEKQRNLEDLEFKLSERDRELAEVENLLKARESVLEAKANQSQSAPSAPLGAAELEALQKLKAEIDRQQSTLQEQKNAIKEREAFLDASEITLFEKVQAQQEKETELEQRDEDLRKRERRFREREAAVDPAAAAVLAAEKAAAKKHNEFLD